jgi:tripeptidyl-peptidase-1
MKYHLLFCALAASAMAVPTAHNNQVHERREFIPKSWTEGRKLDAKVTLPVRIGLTQSNLDRGHGLLMELYGFGQLILVRS